MTRGGQPAAACANAEATDRYSRKLVTLTAVLVTLTAVLILLGIVQLVVAFVA